MASRAPSEIVTPVAATPDPVRGLYRFAVALSCAAALLLSIVALLGRGAALARTDVGDGVEAGASLPRVQCVAGYTATVYAQGLSSPDGLAFSPSRILHVAEEAAGRVSQIGPTGEITPLITGLDSPEGIAFDAGGTLYVVEDVQAGRLIKRTPTGATATLAAGLEAPEGVVWTSNDILYVTESTLQFATRPVDLRTRIAAVDPSGAVTRLITTTPAISGTDVLFWSYAGLTAGPDGLLYVTNETSGQEFPLVAATAPGVSARASIQVITDSIFTVNPATGERTLFTSGLTSPEGLRFSAGGGFPLYVAEEDLGGGEGRLSQVGPDGSHTVLCTGFFNMEDVVVDQRGWLYVSEDTSGLVILIRSGSQYSLTVAPVAATRSGAPGAVVTYTLRVTNTGDVSDTFQVSAGGHHWTTTVDPAAVGPLAAGGGGDVVVGVAVPVSAVVGTTDVVTVTVASRGDPGVAATVSLTTTARGYEVFLPVALQMSSVALWLYT